MSYFPHRAQHGVQVWCYTSLAELSIGWEHGVVLTLNTAQWTVSLVLPTLRSAWGRGVMSYFPQWAQHMVEVWCHTSHIEFGMYWLRCNAMLPWLCSAWGAGVMSYFPQWAQHVLCCCISVASFLQPYWLSQWYCQERVCIVALSFPVFGQCRSKIFRIHNVYLPLASLTPIYHHSALLTLLVCSTLRSRGPWVVSQKWRKTRKFSVSLFLPEKLTLTILYDDKKSWKQKNESHVWGLLIWILPRWRSTCLQHKKKGKLIFVRASSSRG